MKTPIADRLELLDEDWLAETIDGSLDVDWTGRDAARLILDRMPELTEAASVIRELVEALEWILNIASSLFAEAAREYRAALRRVEALEADNARLKADAARYHWLRDISCPPHNFYVSIPDEFHGVLYSPEDVDAYIDQARALMEKANG